MKDQRWFQAGIFPLLFILLGMPGGLRATPDPSLWRREVILGSNPHSYFVLSIERRNPGSYYEATERLALLRYSLKSRKLEKRTLLRETRYTTDPDTKKRTAAEIPVPGKIDLGKLLGAHGVSLAFPVVLHEGRKLFARNGGVFISHGGKTARLTAPAEIPPVFGNLQVEDLEEDEVRPIGLYSDGRVVYLLLRLGKDYLDFDFHHIIVPLKPGVFKKACRKVDCG